MNLLKSLTLSTLFFTLHCGIEGPTNEENFDLEFQNNQTSGSLERSNDLILNTGSLTAIAIENDDDKFDLEENKTLSIAALGDTQIVYLNRRGAILTPGANDSRTNRSSIIKAAANIPAWQTSTRDWNEVVDCVKGMFAPFNIDVVQNDPGDVPHIESVIGGKSTDLGFPVGVAGLSPFTSRCDVIPNAIVYTFVESLPSESPQLVCEITAQEIAHSFGLDHQFLCTDPMSYQWCEQDKSFQDEFSSCGEFEERSCKVERMYDCGRSVQNSYQELAKRVGLRNGSVFPKIEAVGFSQGDFLKGGDLIEINASDDRSITSVEFSLGNYKETSTKAPYEFRIPLDVKLGAQTLAFNAVDDSGNKSELFMDMVIDDGAGQGIADERDNLLPLISEDDRDVAISGCSTTKGKNSFGFVLLGLVFFLGLKPRKERA